MKLKKKNGLQTKKLWNAIVSYADGNYQSIDALYYEQYPFQGRLVVLFSFLVRLTNVRSIMLFKAINAVACAAVAVALACISSVLFRKAEVTTLTGVMTFCFLPIVIYSCFIDCSDCRFGLSDSFCGKGFYK